MVQAMRTTLAIDDDVLAAAKAIAAQSGVTIGEVVSDLARRSLRPPPANAMRNGIRLLSASKAGTVVTLATVNALRDESA